MKIEFISSLNNRSQRGGAYLRVYAIESIYKKLGLDVRMHYLEEYKAKPTLKGAWLSYLTKVNIRTLFNRSKICISDANFLHLDSFRFFNWQVDLKNTKIIYNAHNLEYESYVPRENTLSAQKLKSIELKTISKADHIFVCSDREKKIISQYDEKLGEKVFVIPNLIDKSHYRINENKNIILFIGTLDYYPNIKALEYLINDFYPRLDKQLFEKYRFVVAGRNPGLGLKQKLESLGVELLSDIDDNELTDILSKTYVSLVPLVHGSGTRLKIIESIFSGSLVLSTPLGSEGISSPSIVHADLVAFRSKFEDLIKRVHKIEPAKLQEFYNEFDIDTWYENNSDKLKKFLGFT